MTDPANTSAELQSLIDRLMAGDPEAPKLLLDRAYGRLERIVRKTFHQRYAGLENQHDTASIVSETYLRLHAALGSIQAKAAPRASPMDLGDFFRFVASKTHQVCIDLIRKGRVRRPTAGAGGADEASGAEQIAAPEGADPGLLAQWTEFHDRVERLPDEEREVFQMCFYLDLKRAEAAQVLGIHPKEASRRWVGATEKLKDLLVPLEGS